MDSKHSRVVEDMSNIAVPVNQVRAGTTELPASARGCDHPAGISGRRSTTTPATSLSARLTSLSPVLFCDDINVRIIDIENLAGEFSG